MCYIATTVRKGHKVVYEVLKYSLPSTSKAPIKTLPTVGNSSTHPLYSVTGNNCLTKLKVLCLIVINHWHQCTVQTTSQTFNYVHQHRQ